ncbi:MAG: adenylate/guanylate cyclase domain-containing protein [Burkholderiaceae bacterium]
MTTVVVFADLVGSTGVYESLGDAAASRFVTQLTGSLRHTFEQHGGRVVKVLGDGLFVVFSNAGNALSACVGIQTRLHDTPMHADDGGPAVQFQMGVDAGEVVEIDGDCFGDTVNSAARLADLAGAAQILTTKAVWDLLIPGQRAMLRSMGPMYLRGRAGAIHVYRVGWQTGRDEDATMAWRSMFSDLPEAWLGLEFGDQSVTLAPRGNMIYLGRAPDAALTVNDPRVSRKHATLQWRGGNYIVTDTSTFGTWVYVGNQSEAVVLRRTECFLVGRGTIVPGCGRNDDNAPLIAYSIQH